MPQIAKPGAVQKIAHSPKSRILSYSIATSYESAAMAVGRWSWQLVDHRYASWEFQLVPKGDLGCIFYEADGNGAGYIRLHDIKGCF